MLTLLLKSDDRVALRFWLGFGHQTLNASQYKILKEYCEVTGLSPKDALIKAVEGNKIGAIGNLVVRFQELQTLLIQLSDLSLNDVIDSLFPDGHDWAKPIREIALAKITPQTGIQQLHTILSNIITQPDMPEEGEFVKIMSLHGSKGLTSKVVIVLGCVEGLIPTIVSNTPAEQAADLKEQRRLFYVAITRPTEVLVLSSFASIEQQLAYQIGVQLGGRGRTITSHFISELGPNQPASIQGTDWEKAGYVQ